jgi:hypothetical protein
VGEGVPGWCSPLGTQGERAPSFSERRRFERKRAVITLQAASRFLGSWEEVRRVYRVYIKAVIGRGDL